MKKERYSPQINGVMVLHHNMVLPLNGDTWGELPFMPPSSSDVLMPRLPIARLLRTVCDEKK